MTSSTRYTVPIELTSFMINVLVDAVICLLYRIQKSDHARLSVYQTQRLKEDEWCHPVECQEELGPIGSSWVSWRIGLSMIVAI